MEKLEGRNSNKIEERTEENASMMEDNRWNGLWGEISKLFNVSLQCIFPDLDKYRIQASVHPNDVDELGEFKCQNVLFIWPELRNNLELKGKYPNIKGPRDVGKKIKEKLSESEMIKDLSMNEQDMSAPTCDVGFVTFSLSRKWITKSIHKMLKDGIGTWAPDLGLKVVVLEVPVMKEEIYFDSMRREAIIDTLYRMFKYSNVVSHFGNNLDGRCLRSNEGNVILNKWFSNEEKEDVVIMRKLSSIPAEEDAYKYFKQPIRLAKRDFENACFDLETIRQEHSVRRADWVVFITPVRQQEYIEMCFLVAKLEKWIRSGNEPPMTSYAGYRPCTGELKENIVEKAYTLCEVVAESEAAKLLEYTANAVFDCASRYMFLKNHRLSLWTFDIEEMLEEEGDTFVYLLNKKAEIRKITNGFRYDIDELKKAPELILENDEGLENDKGLGVTKERSLALLILQFTGMVKESCLSVLPHILCKFLHDLSQEFTRYYNHVCKVGSVTETSTLLLCEATAVVMGQCFHLLGLNPESKNLARFPVPMAISSLKQPMEVKARDPPRTSRFELFSFRPSITTGEKFETGKLFGFISVSDKYGLLSDNGGEFFEPDFAHVRLFDHGWRNPRNMSGKPVYPVYLGNPNSSHAVPFSSSIEVIMQLFLTTEEKDAYFELCNIKFNIDTFEFWDKGLDIECRWLDISGVDAVTEAHCVLLRDAVDAYVEVRFFRNTKSRVHGWIRAHYGGEFLKEIHPTFRRYYETLLYESDPDPESSLEIGRIPLRRSMLAVPVEGSLVINAYILDVESDEVILDGCHEFNSQREGSSKVVIYGIETGCRVELIVDWKYQGYKLDESEAGSSSFVSTDGNKPGGEDQLSKERKRKHPM